MPVGFFLTGFFMCLLAFLFFFARERYFHVANVAKCSDIDNQ